MKKFFCLFLLMMILGGCVQLTTETTTSTYTVDPTACNADFDLNGYYAVNKPNTQYLHIGDYVTEPNEILRTGYNFAGWAVDKTGKDMWNFSTDTMATHTLFYAIWEKEEYTISFNLDGGEGVLPSSQKRYYLDYDANGLINKLDEPTENPTKDGFVFCGWWEKDNLGNYIREWNFSTDLPSKTTTLYAGWALAGLNERYAYLDLGSAIKILTYIKEADPTYNDSLVIPSTIDSKPVLSIGFQAFKDVDDYVSITLPTNLTTIHDEAFYDCDSIFSVGYFVIPDSVTSIGEKAFYDCDNFDRVTLGSGVTNIGEMAFYSCDLFHFSISSPLVIPSNVIAIENQAFDIVSAEETVKVLTLNNGLIYIGKLAFDHANITMLTIPETVEMINESAFRCCYDLEEIRIGRAIKEIKAYAFGYCSAHAEVYMTSTLPPILGGGNPSVFGNIGDKGASFWIQVPSDSLNLYKEATNWSTYENKIVVGIFH